MEASVTHLPASTSQYQLESVVTALNTDPLVDGIIMQLPLPPQLSAPPVIDLIRPEKDVDGLHPYNTGKLCQVDGPALIQSNLFRHAACRQILYCARVQPWGSCACSTA